MYKKLLIFFIAIITVFMGACQPSAVNKANIVCDKYEALTNEYNDYIYSEEYNDLFTADDLDVLKEMAVTMEEKFDDYLSRNEAIIDEYEKYNGLLEQEVYEHNILIMNESLETIKLLKLTSVLIAKYKAWGIEIESNKTALEKMSLNTEFINVYTEIEEEANKLRFEKDSADYEDYQGLLTLIDVVREDSMKTMAEIAE